MVTATMRYLAVLALLCAACAAPRGRLEEYPLNEPPAGDEALVAGKFAFRDSKFGGSLRFRSQAKGENLRLDLTDEVFLFAIPPGVYEVTGFGDYEPVDDTLTFEAKTSTVAFIGNFVPARDEQGNTRVVVQGDTRHARRVLDAKYGTIVDDLEVRLVRSALKPVGRATGLVVVVRKPEAPKADSNVRVGIAISSGGYRGMGIGHGG